jgi:hypothetical protein
MCCFQNRVVFYLAISVKINTVLINTASLFHKYKKNATKFLSKLSHNYIIELLEDGEYYDILT